MATKIQLRNWLGKAVAALVMLVAARQGIRVFAGDSSKGMEPAPLKHSTQVASSTSGEAPPAWIATDFAAIALMGLGATIVFLPLPRLQSRKVSTPVGKILAPVIPESVQPLDETLSSPGGLTHPRTLRRSSP